MSKERRAPWSAAILLLALCTLLVTTGTIYAATDLAHTPPAGVSTSAVCIAPLSGQQSEASVIDADDATYQISYTGGGRDGCVVRMSDTVTGSGALTTVDISEVRFLVKGDGASNLSSLRIVCGQWGSSLTTVLYSDLSGHGGSLYDLTVVTHITPAICGVTDTSGAHGLAVEVDGVNTVSGYGMWVYTIELRGTGSPTSFDLAPRIQAVYACVPGTTTCDGTEAVTARGWSPATHGIVLRVTLDPNAGIGYACYFEQTDGPNRVALGGIPNGSSYQTSITLYDPPAVGPPSPLRAGTHDVRCVTSDGYGVSFWPLVLQLNGVVTGASNPNYLARPGATYDPHADNGDTPLSVVFNAWSEFLKSYQSRAPFVFIDPAVKGVTGTIANINAARLPAASGHYGPTTCPGYTMTLPNAALPVAHYDTHPGGSTPGPTATAGGWPSAMPLPSFTVLRCQDFSAITGLDWWHQVRGLMDWGLLIGYGMTWLNRLQPRFQANA